MDIESPEHIMSHEGRELLEIQDNITVSEFEDNNRGSTVNIVFDGNVDGKKEAQFPYPDLNLEGKTVLINNFRVK